MRHRRRRRHLRIELGRLVFGESHTADRTAKIANRADASPLAVTIAQVVEAGPSAARWPADPKAVLLGSVLGAYKSLSALSDAPSSSPEVALFATSGAVAGALAASASAFVMENIKQTPVGQLPRHAGGVITCPDGRRHQLRP